MLILACRQRSSDILPCGIRKRHIILSTEKGYLTKIGDETNWENDEKFENGGFSVLKLDDVILCSTTSSICNTIY